MTLFSRELYIYSGNNTFTISFPFIDRTHVRIERDRQQLEVEWLDWSTVRVHTPLEPGDKVLVYRNTPRNASLVRFSDGHRMSEHTLDVALTQYLYAMQEFRDILACVDKPEYLGGLEETQYAELIHAIDVAGRADEVIAEIDLLLDAVINHADRAESQAGIAEGHAADAQAAKSDAEHSATEARSHRDDALIYKQDAEIAANRAETAEAGAEAAQAAAEAAQAASEAAQAASEAARDDAQAAATAAEQHRDVAEAARDDAQAAKSDAEYSATEASSHRDNALIYKQDAETAANQAEAAQAAAEAAQAASEAARDDAQEAATTAEQHRDAAEAARDDAQDAKAVAEDSATEARSHRDDTLIYKQDAEAAANRAEAAQAAAEAARDDAQEAATAAGTSESNAQAAAMAAQAAQTAAEGHAASASASAADAADSATAAQAAKTAAEGHAAAAAASAADAADSAAAAQQAADQAIGGIVTVDRMDHRAPLPDPPDQFKHTGEDGKFSITYLSGMDPYYPTPFGTLVEFNHGADGAFQVLTDDYTGRAWFRVWRYIGQPGPWRQVVFTDDFGGITPWDVKQGAIVESGHTPEGSYYKWESGLMVVYFVGMASVTINNAYGSLYYGSVTYTFPQEFYGNPDVSAGRGQWGSGASWTGVASWTAMNTTIRYYDTQSRGAANVIVSYSAIGRWK